MNAKKEHFKHIRCSTQNGVASITLARPQVHNAFDDATIAELTQAFRDSSNDNAARAILLASEGPTFCAGADLNWMKRTKSYTVEENLRDAQRFADLLLTINTAPKPVLALVQGPVYGGGIGILCACDWIAASNTATFRVSEVTFGLCPAVISPYLLRRMGERVCRELFLLANTINAEMAYSYGLVNKIVPPYKLEEAGQQAIQSILANGPKALAGCKDLLYNVPRLSHAEARDFTTSMLASLRAGNEAQEGMTAFLEKRPPSWRNAPKQ